jgi:hypothetical protein
VPIDQIELDRHNPRIRKYVEMYDGVITEDRLRLALLAESADEAHGTTTTVGKLKASIQTNGTIVQPIIVNKTDDGRLVCIEGNTRVKLYEEFRAQDPADNRWHTIPAIVYSNLGQADIDAIRLQVHLVGPRPWEPYSKAKFLAQLRNEQHLQFSEIVDFAGGQQREVEQQIRAYEEMEQYYRAVIPDDGSFDTKRFSGFVELQAPDIKRAIAEAGFDLYDFARWLHEKRLKRLEDIRLLPRILKHPEAKKAFLKEGSDSRKALEQLQRPDISKSLLDADISQLVRALSTKIQDITLRDLQALRGDDSTAELLEARDAIKFLLDVVRNPAIMDTDPDG